MLKNAIKVRKTIMKLGMELGKVLYDSFPVLLVVSTCENSSIIKGATLGPGRNVVIGAGVVVVVVVS